MCARASTSVLDCVCGVHVCKPHLCARVLKALAWTAAAHVIALLPAQHVGCRQGYMCCGNGMPAPLSLAQDLHQSSTADAAQQHTSWQPLTDSFHHGTDDPNRLNRNSRENPGAPKVNLQARIAAVGQPLCIWIEPPAVPPPGPPMHEQHHWQPRLGLPMLLPGPHPCLSARLEKGISWMSYFREAASGLIHLINRSLADMHASQRVPAVAPHTQEMLCMM